uniref:Uncharacterized protein n=2 Tax=Aegilops tauschii subsp. strangulata TaxID=200361 RepID=A0A453C880_AEGTS
MLEVLTSGRHNTCHMVSTKNFLLWLMKISHSLNLSTRMNFCILIGYLAILLSGHGNFLFFFEILKMHCCNRWVKENKLNQLQFAQKMTYCYLSAAATIPP